MIREARDEDFDRIYEIINDAAIAYKGVIPADRWHEPYMPRDELREQIANGVKFSCYIEADEILGVMGIQDRTDVALIRHAYVATKNRNNGIGSLLLRELIAGEQNPVLIGTWQAARWAIAFYEKNGFTLIDDGVKVGLLRKYWGVPERQIETSVVLADRKFLSAHPECSVPRA
jgi:N-acetylglutamate synthase-like GNAT family acetyltransferase